MADGSPVLDLLRTGGALLLGYLVGSLPLATWVGRAAGVAVTRQGERNPGSASVWMLAGPGWGLLALAGDLAKGVLPVAVAIVTFSWWTGWAAGVAAVVGAGWPAFGRLPGGRGVAALVGACLALSPRAAAIGILVTLLALGVARVTGRRRRLAAITAGLGVYPPLLLAVEGDLGRLAGIGVLFLLAAIRYRRTDG